jgi:ABC-type oligopeptide transport system substrate-binding subunit
MNVARPPFDELKVRQAVNHALNVPEIVNALASGIAAPVETILPVKSPYHPKPGTYTTYPFSSTERALLAEPLRLGAGSAVGDQAPGSRSTLQTVATSPTRRSQKPSATD